MDKLKTKVLFISLIILALLSIGAVAAADDASDEIISQTQDDFDLSEETVSDVQSAQETEVLTDDEPAQNPDGSSYITVKFSYITEDGPVEVVNQSLSKKVAANRNLTISYSNLLNNKPPANRFKYDGLNYNFTLYWKNSVTGEIFKQGRGCDQVFLPTGYNYTVVLTAQYETYEDTFVNISYIVKDSSGDDVNITETYNIPYPGSFYEVFVSKNNFTNLNKTYKGYTLDGYEYYLDHWEDGDGNVVDSTKSYNHGYTGENYTVTYKAIYKAKGNPSNITVKIVGLKDVNGNDVNSELTNKIDPGVTWIIRYAMFEDEIDRYNTYDANGIHYTFKHLLDPEGVPITDPESYERTLKPNGTDYTVVFTAVYDEEVIGNFTLIYTDKFGHGSGSWSSINNYGVDFTHTFRTPEDIPSGAVFLYWEREDTKEKYYPNSSDQYQYTITYEEFAGKDVKVYVNAVYDLKTSIELEEITGYVGDVVDIVAKITENVNNTLVPTGGTATLTIDYSNKLSNGLLGASTYTQTVEVVDGQAVFKDVKLENPGTYAYKVEYSGYEYNQHSEGINDYLSSEADSKLNILPLNTTTTSEDVSGTVGDKKDITTDIVDQNGDPVQNGTAVLKVNGKEYTAEVKDGKAVFKDVELTENTTATIEYLGNDYYNPSNTTIEITVTAPEEPEEPAEEPSDDPEEPADEPEEEPSTPVAEKAIPIIPATGNPIALVILALLTLVSTVSLGNKK
jgi:hypothetical protein